VDHCRIARILTTLLATWGTVALVGCATAPPAVELEPQAAVIDKPFDATWSKIIQFLSDHDVQIKTIEKASGVIYARLEVAYHVHTGVVGIITAHDFRYSTPAHEWLDCGAIHGQPVGLSIDVNMYVREQSSGHTALRVTVNATEQQNVAGLLLNSSYQNFHCDSTGVLEKDIIAVASKD